MKVIALSLVAVIALSIVAIAGDDKMETDRDLTGTVSKISLASKKMTIADQSGKDNLVYWDDNTTVAGGELKVGATIRCRVSEKDGQWWALSIRIGDKSKSK